MSETTNEITYVRLGQDEKGQLWLLKQVGINWVPHRKVTSLIEGNDFIIEEPIVS